MRLLLSNKEKYRAIGEVSCQSSPCIMCVQDRGGGGGGQYRGGHHEYCGGCLEYRGGCLEYRGGCSVPWGNHDKCEGISVVPWGCSVP